MILLFDADVRKILLKSRVTVRVRLCGFTVDLPSGKMSASDDRSLDDSPTFEKVPMAVPLGENLVTLIYGPDEEADSIQVSRTKLMKFSCVAKAMIQGHLQTLRLPLKYPTTFRQYCVPILLEEDEAFGAEADEGEDDEVDDPTDLAAIYQRTLDSTGDESSDLCYLFQMAEHLCLEELKADLREILVKDWQKEIAKPAFSPDNISKTELLYFFIYAKLSEDDCFKIILYWLEGASMKYCRKMKVWFERKLNYSFTKCLVSYREKNELDSLQQCTGSAINKFFTALDVLSIQSVEKKKCRYCHEHSAASFWPLACPAANGKAHDYRPYEVKLCNSCKQYIADPSWFSSCPSKSTSLHGSKHCFK